MRIEEEINVTGFFWLPELPDEKIQGDLVITDSGTVRLSTVGNFKLSAESFNASQVPRILGMVEKYGYVTLENCIYENRQINLGGAGISKSTIFAHLAYLGVAFNKDESPTWESIVFSVEGLDEWYGRTGISATTDFDTRTAKIEYKPQDDLLLWSENGLTLSIVFSWTLPGFPVLTEAKISQRAYLQLASDKPLSTTEMTGVCHRLVSFLCFAIDETVSIRDVSLKSNNITDQTFDCAVYSKTIKLYYRSLFYKEKPPKVEWYNMLFRYAQIATKSQSIIGNWLKAYEKISPAISLYFGSRTEAHKYLNGKFLALAQGLETYHRRVSDEKTMPEDELKALTAEVVKSAPSKYRDLLESRLQHANELPLRKRLDRMISSFDKHFGSKKEQKSLICKITDTRNYFTHYSPSLESKAVDGVALWELCMKMEALFQLYLLKEISFSDGDINTIVQNNRWLIKKLGLATEEFKSV